MVKKNKFQRVGIRTALSAAMLLTATSASAVTVDGNLGDLISAISAEPLAPGNVAMGTESGTDGESNGFDITNGYAWYNVASDTFYVGMKFAGQVGTSGGDEPFANWCGSTFDQNATAGVFDGCENYGFSITINSGPNATLGTTRLDISGDNAANSGEGTEADYLLTDNLGLTLGDFNWAVSETDDGVEFSVTGLATALGNFSPNNPTDVTIGFYAGSITNYGPEDILELNMQVVPVPAAVWLLGSGLLGLMGFSTRGHRIATQNNSRG